MKEKWLLKKVCRYHRVSHNKRLEGLISLYKDSVYIKIDSVYDSLKPRDTHYETYMTFEVHYNEIVQDLINGGATEKLARKISDVLVRWYADGLFTFDEAGIISINGGQSNENIRKN